MNLLIVESPGKVKKIQGFLGNDWKVAASIGHVRDLPKSGENDGICPPDFKPHYILITGKERVFAELSKLVKDADQIYLATDPDREGEAIAWHLKDLLRLKDPHRVTFSEITEKAVKKAVATPRKINMPLVAAQETRRVLDRLYGYNVRPAISAAAKQNLTAGRVQSPALRLVVDREMAIRDFRSTTHYGAELIFDGWKATWNTKNWLEKGQEYIIAESVARKIAALRTLEVFSYEEAESKQGPPPPFITSTLQQAASNALKLNPKETMELAQKLYEGGHITYMRTDSPNLSPDAIMAIRNLATQNKWPLPPTPRTWKSKDGAQEAHEAIRPTHFEYENKGDTDLQIALYNLIRVRALASQLDDAVYATTKAVLETELDNNQVIFEAKGRRLISSGWKMILDGDAADPQKHDDELDNQVPKLEPLEQIKALSGEVKTKKTKPPARYTQATLIRDLEKRGIGRPSTYAAIMDNISKREYIVENKKRQLESTPSGEKLISCLVGNFGFVDYDFTKQMETELDDIALGKNKYLAVVRAANEGLEKELLAFVKSKGFACPDCGKLVIHFKGISKKTDKPYDFWLCSNNDCKASFVNDNGKLGPKQEPKAPIPLSQHKCDVCGKALRNVVKEGSSGYNFWSCSGFPNCKTSYKNDNGKPGAKNEPKKKGTKK
ncbi:MAG: type I DNA topoisomerase [Candidatus Adiutrix sp.]